MLCALIMAGGKGTRFWPLSTEKRPKQFLKLLGEETMIQMTVNRIKDLIPKDRTFVVTSSDYVELVKNQLPDLPSRNIIVEPVGKNTAPCIALSAFYIEKIYKDATMIVLPSDHLIENEEKFRDTINCAYDFIQNNEDGIVTLGMKPTRPEIGYGYIKASETGKLKIGNEVICKVDSFVEKPDLDKAKRYVEGENYLWNGGMFIWKATTILNLTKKFLKSTYQVLEEIAIATEDEYGSKLVENYCKVQAVSVDYGIMENAKEIYVIPCDFGWDDVGSWHAIERYREKDEHNNVVVGKVRNIEGNNNFIVGKDKLIITVGLDDVFVVETDDVILLCKKENIDNIQELRKIIL
ncbi:mannose-1-phosphate guanylyltransferase [Clostridium estertheticum]|uniref:mannose-1-phosphate guanylyltransferase n=1 Tax=Clostridium estertheticum TaxID=238834 RepID=UPI001C0B4A10|nr:mannose-1-phosphate guanylyltransferase [Clostridium estertheticum]MBU3073203.1 mannose-1-phosphate guanylyltransferase [Clostridium estertheticum]MBU3163556.1 mannose-1-phosphate guanylyltransferase [Clostridium estertheticum]